MAAKYYGVMMVNVQGLELLIVNLKNLKPLEHVKKISIWAMMSIKTNRLSMNQ